MNQRQIKFRAWLNHPEEMVNDFYVNGNEIVYDDGRGLMKRELDNDIIIMQFAGLKDKNGKDIYEGDIVKFQDGNPVLRLIEWHVIGLRVKAIDKGWNFPLQYPFISGAETDWEVVGNVHENPELLTK